MPGKSIATDEDGTAMLVYKDGNPFTVVYVPFNPQDSSPSMDSGSTVAPHYGRLPPLWQRRLWGYNNPRYPDYKPRGSGATTTSTNTHRPRTWKRGPSGYYFSHKKKKWVKSKFVTRYSSKQRYGR